MLQFIKNFRDELRNPQLKLLQDLILELEEGIYKGYECYKAEKAQEALDKLANNQTFGTFIDLDGKMRQLPEGPVNIEIGQLPGMVQQLLGLENQVEKCLNSISHLEEKMDAHLYVIKREIILLNPKAEERL